MGDPTSTDAAQAATDDLTVRGILDRMSRETYEPRLSVSLGEIKDYQDLVRRMWEVTGNLTQQAEAAGKEIAEVSAKQGLLPKLLAWGEYGIPNEDWEKLTSAGWSPSVLANFGMAFKEPHVIKTLAAPSVMIAQVASTTVRLMREVVATTFQAKNGSI